jgi:hypothetical protein
MLIRPDGYIAWAADRMRPERRDNAIRDALVVHCGQ